MRISCSGASASAWKPWRRNRGLTAPTEEGRVGMVGGGIDYEGELAAARLRMKLEQDAGSLAESQRLRREEGREQFEGRLLVLAVVGVIYVLLDLFA